MTGARRWYLLTPSWTSVVTIKVHARIPTKKPTATLAPKSATMPAPTATHHPSWYGLVRPIESPSKNGDLLVAAEDHLFDLGGSEPPSRRPAVLTVENAR